MDIGGTATKPGLEKYEPVPRENEIDSAVPRKFETPWTGGWLTNLVYSVSRSLGRDQQSRR